MSYLEVLESEGWVVAITSVDEYYKITAKIMTGPDSIGDYESHTISAKDYTIPGAIERLRKQREKIRLGEVCLPEDVR